MKIILELTEEQAETLEGALELHTDVGDFDEGWQSQEFYETRRVVEEAIKKAREEDNK